MRVMDPLTAAAATIGCLHLATPARAAPQDANPAVAVVVAGAATERSGDVIRHAVSVEGKQVPLPDGDWIIAGTGLASPSGQLPLVPSIASVALLRLRQDRIDAAILIQTNRRLARIKWSPAASCDRTDLYFAQVRYASDHDGSCAYAAYVKTDTAARIDPAWTMARRTALAKGWQIPTVWVDVVFRITDPLDVVQVRYLFDPWGRNDLATRRLPDARIHSLIGWTAASWDVVEAGFRNRIDDAPAFSMQDWSQSADSALDSSGAQPALPQDQDTIGHLGAKMVTYRTFGTLTDLTVNYLWLGSLPSAGGLAIVSAVASSALYFVHELVWSRYDKPTATPANLAGVGEEGPQPVAN